MKMPGLSRGLHSNHSSSSSLSGYVGSGSDGRSAVWTRSNTEDVNLGQLHKFWNELSSAERRELLRIDKHTLFEQVRKNLYCSRCHGLLVEGFAQIMNGKNRHSGLLAYSSGCAGGGSRHTSENGSSGGLSSMDDTRDPSVHSWGGLAATRDNMLTVLDCFLEGTPLEVLQNVFESARTRERERELLYPDACGGGGRGWISQSVGNFGGSGRGHGLKETCALHTARLSCEALVDFWAALGEETRRSLLRMKEEDFIERLMFRFDSKRFCRDCRRNVLREFKEMKELKRTRKEPRCTRWFCAADTVFRYEVSDSMVHVDWRDCFAGDVGTVYQRFEWAVGTAEGKSDILGFEDVGLSETVQIDGLDLGSVSACHITIRGLRRDGRTLELVAKAHALKGQLCVHRRLIVGDGIVSITKGESIQRFFERAEETEEEEDEDSMDKDGNDLDGEGTRPQKHAKSPELARDFLLDAATVIFKEQVEKAFREGTARQNAHSIFVCLALSLLEERVRVACKEITTLEKQNKLLEEEEDEKREEEERRERRKLREKEKKLRKKEKLKGRAKDRSKGEVKSLVITTNGHTDSMSCASEEEQECSSVTHADGESRISDSTSARPSSPDMVEARPSGDGSDSDCVSGKSNECISGMDDVADTLSKRDGNGAFIFEQSKSAKRRSQLRKNQVIVTSSSCSARKGPHRTAGYEDNNCGPARDPISGSLQQCGSTGNRKVGTDNNHHTASVYSLKRFDSWSSTVSETHKRHEHHQQCACGSPQNGVRVKIHSQRSIARIVSKDAGSAKAERDGYSASVSRPLCGNETEVPAEAQGKRDTLEILDEWKDSLTGESTIGAEASREQRQDAEVNGLSVDGCAGNYADGGSAPDGAAGILQLGSSNGHTGSMDFCNGHTTTQVGPSSASTGKLVWVSNTANSSSSSLAGVSAVKTPAVSAGRASVNGNLISKVAASRTGQGKARRPNGMTVVPRAAGVESGALLPSSTASGPVSISTSSATLATTAPASDEGSETAVISVTGEPSNGSHSSMNEAPPVVVSDGNIMTSKLQRSSSSSSLQQYSVRTAGSGRTGPHTSTLSTASDPFEPESMRQQNYIKTASGPRNGLSLESKVLEANCSRPPVHAVVATGMMQAMEGPGPGQHFHAEKNVLIHNGAVIPPGMVVGPHHLHSGPQSGLPTPGNGVRPMKNMFPGSAEMLPMAACGPVPMHLHPSQQSYGYFHMQPQWAPRGRNGVLPLPQPGGFLLSGPGGMGMPMGSLPPMSLPVPASLQPLPPPSLAGPGHFQVPMQNGLNSLARETAFLSRYGGRNNGTPPGVTRSGGHQVLALSQPEAGLSVPQEEAKHANDGGSPTSVGPVDAEGPASGANDDSPVLNKSGGNFPPFHFGGPASSPAAQVLEPDSSSKDTGSSKEKKHVATTKSSSEPNVPEISRTRRCVDEHAAGTGSDLCSPAAGEYSLFAAAPGKGLGFF